MSEHTQAPLQLSVGRQKSDAAPFAWVIHQGDESEPIAKSSIAYKTLAAARDAGRRALSGIQAKQTAAAQR